MRYLFAGVAFLCAHIGHWRHGSSSSDPHAVAQTRLRHQMFTF
jgi:hypothetical protein